jgi:uncharacterized protein (TIGR02118 family)
MIRVSVFYPNTPGATFDHTYYAEKHCPMVQERLRPFGCVRIEIDKGLLGGTPDAPAPFVAVGHVIIHSVEGWQQGLAAHGQEILGDIPNYTNIAPQMQISEIVA